MAIGIAKIWLPRHETEQFQYSKFIPDVTLFVFDNLSGHLAFATVALVPNWFNLIDGGANVKPMRPGWFIGDKAENVNGDRS